MRWAIRWRRMMNEFHANKALGELVTKVLSEKDPDRKAIFIDELYKMNAGQRNNLTGPSGNTVGALLAAYDPIGNLLVVTPKLLSTVNRSLRRAAHPSATR